MSHETHSTPGNKRPIIEFRTALLFVLILAGLFIAALAFISSMSGDSEGGHGDAQHAEATMPGHGDGNTHGEVTEGHEAGGDHNISGSSSAHEQAAGSQAETATDNTAAPAGNDTARDKGVHH